MDSRKKTGLGSIAMNMICRHVFQSLRDCDSSSASSLLLLEESNITLSTPSSITVRFCLSLSLSISPPSPPTPPFLSLPSSPSLPLPLSVSLLFSHSFLQDTLFDREDGPDANTASFAPASPGPLSLGPYGVAYCRDYGCCLL